ncbi:MAG: beta-propeller fold lactonase family protein, partial [Planctomycetia bacterium]
LEMVETVPTEKIPRAFQIDPSGEFLVAAGQESGGIAAYKIDKATGKLTLTDTMSLGKSPSWVEITLGR